MLWKIVRRELREHLLSFRFAVILGLTLLLMVASAMVFSVEYGNALRDYPRRVEGLVDDEGKTNLQGVPCSGFSVQRMPVEMGFCANLGGVLVGQLRRVDRQAQIHGAFMAINERLPHEPGMDAFALAEVDRERAQARERTVVQYIDELVRQVRLGQHLTRISPASTFTYAVEEATGGGIGRLEKFVENVVRFRRGVLAAVLEADREDPESEHRYRPYYCGGAQFSQRKVDLGPAKEFRDPPPSSAEGLEAALLDLALLVLYNGVLFLVTYLRFVRQDVAPGAAL